MPHSLAPCLWPTNLYFDLLRDHAYSDRFVIIVPSRILVGFSIRYLLITYLWAFVSSSLFRRHCWFAANTWELTFLVFLSFTGINCTSYYSARERASFKGLEMKMAKDATSTVFWKSVKWLEVFILLLEKVLYNPTFLCMIFLGFKRGVLMWVAVLCNDCQTTFAYSKWRKKNVLQFFYLNLVKFMGKASSTFWVHVDKSYIAACFFMAIRMPRQISYPIWCWFSPKPL